MKLLILQLGLALTKYFLELKRHSIAADCTVAFYRLQGFLLNSRTFLGVGSGANWALAFGHLPRFLFVVGLEYPLRSSTLGPAHNQGAWPCALPKMLK